MVSIGMENANEALPADMHHIKSTRVKKHVLVCEEHKDEDDNKTVLHDYKKRCILKERKVELSYHSIQMLLQIQFPKKVHMVFK